MAIARRQSRRGAELARAVVAQAHAVQLHVPVAGGERGSVGRLRHARLAVEQFEDARARGGRPLRQPERHAE